MLLPFCLIWRKKPQWSQKKQLLVGIVVATVVLTVVMSLLNLWVLTPLYMAVWNWKSTLPVSQLVALGVLPFNIIKGLLVTGIFAIVATQLKPWLAAHRYQ